MTNQDIEAAIRAAGVGWDPVSRGRVIEDPATKFCNANDCASLARVATDAGVTAEVLAEAVLAREIETLARASFRAELRALQAASDQAAIDDALSAEAARLAAAGDPLQDLADAAMAARLS